MGRHAGYIALWCGIANGAEDVLIPEKYDYNEQEIINHIIESRKTKPMVYSVHAISRSMVPGIPTVLIPSLES